MSSTSLKKIMIVFVMNGRLGNQMFKYAASKALAKKYNEEVYLDWSKVNARHEKEDDGWEDSLKYFNTNYNNIDKQEYLTTFIKVVRTINYKAFLFNNKLAKRTGKRIKKSAFAYWLEGLFGIQIFDTGFIPLLYNARRKINYYQGYFESPRYFDEIKPLLLDDFTPKFPPKKENSELYQVINENESICVSIRRGDFFSEKYAKEYGICNENYFINGVNLIKKEYPNVVVIAFSDDIEWVKTNIDFGLKTYYESGNDELWEKMRLMYSCKHFVISNSTFSWWAQYLSRNPQKIVVAPDIWNKAGKACALYEDSWKIIETGSEK